MCRMLGRDLGWHPELWCCMAVMTAAAYSLDGPSGHLVFSVVQERTKVKALSEELENPLNVHR